MSGPRRILLTLEYAGTRYCGWQRQLNGVSVQETVEKALGKAEGRLTAVTGASRTDAGVHALGQRAHFDTEGGIPPDKYPYVLNALLPRDIRASASREVPPGLHARFSARGKEYTYRIFNRRQASALRDPFCAHVPLPLDLAAMQSACHALLGRHDFRAFQASGGSARSFLRTLSVLEVQRRGDEISILAVGDAFLYNMVRIIAGTLIGIGLGKLEGEAFARALLSGNRLELGPTAPARGLELTRVFYEGGI